MSQTPNTFAGSPAGNGCPSAKIVIVGETFVGKSAVAWRFCRGDFQAHLEPTVGAAFMWRVSDVPAQFTSSLGSTVTPGNATSNNNDNNNNGSNPTVTPVSSTTGTNSTNTTTTATPAAAASSVPTRRLKYEIWDTAGQERYRSLVPVYYRGAAAAIVMYDVTDRRSFERAILWIHELRQNIHSNDVHIVLVGNKADLVQQRQVSAEEGEELARDEHLSGFLETSAKDNMNVDETFALVGSLVLSSMRGTGGGDQGNGFQLGESNEAASGQRWCCSS